MRLIDADALLKELRKSCEYHAENSREFSLLQRDIIIVQEQPTVDAVPVIRCRYCEHYAGEGMYCAWNMIARSDGYCFHANEKPEYADD